MIGNGIEKKLLLLYIKHYFFLTYNFDRKGKL